MGSTWLNHVRFHMCYTDLWSQLSLIMAYVNARDVGNVGSIFLSSVFSTIGHPLMRRHPLSVGGSVLVAALPLVKTAAALDNFLYIDITER